MMRQLPIFTILTLSLSSSCILPYDLGVPEYDMVIVVDGVITTENQRHLVHLNYTAPIHTGEQPPLQGARVWVESSSGSSFNFIEELPGFYQAEIAFAANPENDYQLFFQTNDGKLYQSNRSRPIPSPPIDSIYDQYAELIPVNSSELDAGIQFFLDSHDPTNQAQFYRYEWEETYKIVTPYISRFEYSPTANQVINREIPISICYASNYSNSLLIGTSVGAIESRMAEFPIRFVSGSNDILRNRYSILVRQFAIDGDTYNYYQRLKDSERSGTLFDEQQGTVSGNITAVDNPGEVVLGNFEVSGVTSTRVFFSFSDLDE